MINWRDHIHSDPGILKGRPVVKGTRITVEFLLKLLSGGWGEEKILAEYPHLTADGVRAAADFAREIISEEVFVAIRKAKPA